METKDYTLRKPNYILQKTNYKLQNQTTNYKTKLQTTKANYQLRLPTVVSVQNATTQIATSICEMQNV